MKTRWLLVCFVLLLLPLWSESRTRQHVSPKKTHSPAGEAEQALHKLMAGNRRFATHHMRHPHETIQRRIRLAKAGQHPFAIVLSCADSRVPPEIIFDEGLGDLFVVRIAGNIVDDAVIGSIEYAAEHLGAKLLVVLGHEKCGAVHAAVENQHEAHLQTLVEAIRPAVEKIRRQEPNADSPRDTEAFAEQVARENVRNVVSALQANKPLLIKLVSDQRLRIVGSYYHLSSGKVEVFTN